MNEGNRKFGNLGEDNACSFLAQKNYSIVERNYTVRGGEIDIIAKKADILVFIEVKTRTKKGPILACEAVSKTKQKRIINSAIRYIAEQNYLGACRFDVIEIYRSPEMQIIHYENAFEASD